MLTYYDLVAAAGGVPTCPLPDEQVRAAARQLTQDLFTSQFLLVLAGSPPCCLYCSPSTERLLGYAHTDQLSPERLHEAIHPADVAAVDRASALAREFLRSPWATPTPGTKPCFSLDYRLRDRAGHYLHVLRQSFSLSQDAYGRSLAQAHVFTDLTAHKKTTDVGFTLDYPGFAAWLATRPRPHGPDELSGRERQILALTLAGATVAAIAQQLFISCLTVKTHRQNIRAKIKSADLSQRLAHLGAGAILEGVGV